MKVILSRKGFDSGYGGYPSPILPDGRLISLPIPSAEEEVSYRDLLLDGLTTYFEIMQMLKPSILTNGRNEALRPNTSCHLDPDIRPSVLKRKAGWKGLFGQIDAAQGHLDNQGVCPGDLFLFFGWFRNTINVDGRLAFDRSGRNGRHIIFGYLQIGEVWRVTSDASLPAWARYHPHASPGRRERVNNTIYVARDRLTWSIARPGFGVFRYAPHLVLTAPNATRSRWNLPDFFRETSISYHSPSSWEDGYFLSAAKGQEFVIEADKRVMEWAKELIERGAIH